MDYSGASSYIYAKVCGLLSKAYVGQNSLKLFNARSLSEIWELVFNSSAPLIPEQLLANKIETEAVKKCLSDYCSLLSLYSKPDSFLIELLRRYEIENIKVISAALSMGEEKIPRVVNLGQYELLNYDAWPNIKKITENTNFAWYDHIPDLEERQKMDYKLDLQEIRTLWKSVNKISDSSRTALVEYFTEEYKIQNMLWALRLKVYYKMKDEDILKNLFYIKEQPSSDDPLLKNAIEIFGKAPDNYDDWKKWRYASYLNSHEEGNIWSIDPMWIEQKLRVGEVGRAKRILHQYPATYASLVMYFRIKQQELNVIRAATEAIRLNADKTEAMYVSGLTDSEAGGVNNG